jgi:hypothetical protein
MSDQTTQKEKVMGKINEIKKNVETFIADVNVNELKESLNTMVKDAQKDFSNLVDKDLGVLKTKFAKEKGILEKKAKKFYEGHKKEINALQAKFEKMVKTSGKKQAPKVAKAAPKAAAPKKKVATKKVAKVVQKITKKSKKK